MLNSNKKMGNKFERELCEELAKNGFWTYNCPQTNAGQPADIIAVANGNYFLLDAKECRSDRFDLTRIESNQIHSMEKFAKAGGKCGFILGFPDKEPYYISFGLMMYLSEIHSTLTFSMVKSNGGVTLKEFIQCWSR